METREIGRVVVAAGESIMELSLVQWWLWNLIHVVVAGDKGTVEGKEQGKERLVEDARTFEGREDPNCEAEVGYR